MIRLTMKTEEGYIGVVPEKYQAYFNESMIAEMVFNLLGTLEDLMEKYNIDSIDELEARLQRPAVYTYQSEEEYQKFKKILRNDNDDR